MTSPDPNPKEPRALPAWPARFLRLQLGLFVFALSVTLMLEARVGLDPWSAVHEGLVLQTDVSFGRMVQLVGLLLIAVSWTLLRVKPGLGTICNMLFIGLWIDVLRDSGWIPVHAQPDLPAYAQFIAGILVNGLATALYIGARFGAGPRDSFVLGLSARLGRSVRATRIGVESALVVTAFLIGGTIAWGTLIFTVLMGPVMQASLRLLHVSTDPNARGSAGPDGAVGGTSVASGRSASR